MSSPWTHNICASCYNERNPGRQPIVVKEPYRETEKCCFCGASNFDGIYTRHDPKELKCVERGYHVTE